MCETGTHHAGRDYSCHFNKNTDATALASTTVASIGLCAADCCDRATCLAFGYESTACKAHDTAGTISTDAGHWYCTMDPQTSPVSPPPSPPPAAPAFFSASQLTDYHNTNAECYDESGVTPQNAADQWTGTKAEAEYRCAMLPGCLALHDYK